MDSPKKIIFIALGIAAGAYWYFFTGTGAPATITSGLTESQAQTQFQVLMSALPSAFDTSIFEDARFGVLIDISTSITPESAGRPDPFATLSGTLSR